MKIQEVNAESHIGNTKVTIKSDEDETLDEVMIVVYNTIQGLGYHTNSVDKYISLDGEGGNDE